MLVTRQPVLRRFWYPVMPIVHLETSQPQAFELLGEKLVLWLNADGQPSALRDRCCHRSAQLSKEVAIDGNIHCPYHGWSYNATGTCVNVPQFAPDQAIPASYKVPAYQCTERYGYVWVCLGEPLLPIPHIAQAEDPTFRLIPELCRLELSVGTYLKSYLSVAIAKPALAKAQPHKLLNDSVISNQFCWFCIM